MEHKNLKNTLKVKSDAYRFDILKQTELLMLEDLFEENNRKGSTFQKSKLVDINPNKETFPVFVNENETEEDLEGIDAIFRKKGMK